MKSTALLHLCLYAFLAILTAACTPTSHYQGPTMGTSFHVTVKGKYQAKINAQLGALLADIDAKMSTYKKTSELSRFNAMGAGCMPMSADTLQVVKTAQHIYKQSGGSFDPSVGALVDLWGFGAQKHQSVPTTAQIQAAKAQLGFQHIRIDQQQLCKNHGDIRMDLSAIAKGYAVDVLADYLKNQGFEHFLVEVGGELYAYGKKDARKPWRIGIETPNQNQGQAFKEHALPLSNVAVATSGDYRNYFEKDGVRYSHSIDPKTGSPIRHKLASVTVLAENCTLADGWATALMVAGEQEGLKIANQQHLAAYFIYKTKDGFASQKSAAFAAQFASF